MPRRGLALIVAVLWLISGVGTPTGGYALPKHVTYPVHPIASSPGNQYVGAVGGPLQLFVGFLNGTVVKMDPDTGGTMGSVALPDGNSAAHLAYYDGALFVGTEYLHGARDKAPYHVYKIDPVGMTIKGEVPMDLPYANGFVVPIDGYIWAGDGHCSLYKIDPTEMKVKGVVLGAAEDEMMSDGFHYWGECRNVVNAMDPGLGLPRVIASGSLTYPNRPRGFFMVDSGVYTSGTQDYVLYSMSIRGTLVHFDRAGALGNHSLPTRDSVILRGLLYTYQTGSQADSGWMTSRVFVYDHHFRMRTTVLLPGPALSSDASQHTLFGLYDRLYFVTQSEVGYIVLPPGVGNWASGGSGRTGVS